ncbi:unnamed protein product, partial [Amoebophrya sp. A25]|eukprot:GSA25T00009668001.1
MTPNTKKKGEPYTIVDECRIATKTNDKGKPTEYRGLEDSSGNLAAPMEIDGWLRVKKTEGKSKALTLDFGRVFLARRRSSAGERGKAIGCLRP